MSTKADLSSVSLILHPITLIPVDSGAYDIRVDIVYGRKNLGATSKKFLVENNAGVRLCIGSEFDTVDLGHGWDPAQHLFPSSPSKTGTVNVKPTVFKIVWDKNLWAQTVPCWAYLYDWKEQQFKDSKSNPVTMQMPIYPYKGWLTVDGIGTSQPPPKYLLPPQGRRLVQLRYSARGPALGQLLFIDPQLRLEISEQYRGFDIYTSILALTDITMGVCKVAALNGDALATILKGVYPSPVPAMGTWQQITSNLPNAQSGWLMLGWNISHAFLIAHHPAHDFVVVEYGANGYKQTPAQAWQGSGTYHVRRLIHTKGVPYSPSGVASDAWGQTFKDIA